MRLATLALVVAAALGLAGCGPRATIPTLPPEPSGTPLFETEEEALAAAEAAYAAYLATSDLIAQEGGVDPERIAAVATGELYEDAVEDLQAFAESGWRSTGASVLARFLLQDFDPTGSEGSSPIVVAYICVDVSMVDVVDSSGASVVSPSRPPLQALEVTFDSAPTASGTLLPSSSDPWDGGGVCD